MTEAADRFVRGAGEFSDDRRVEMATHAVTLRSPHAHARIASITVSAALARSGVLAMLNAVRPDEISNQPGSTRRG